MRTTLRDIARHANVHYSTVSHVLNGTGGNTRVSDETRRRVEASAEQLGYVANRAAQQLKTRRGRVVGLLVGALENPFFARMVSMCSAALERAGYDVVLAVRRNDQQDDLHLLEALVSRQLDGILLWSETITEVRERIRQPDMAQTVVMGYEIPGRDCVSGTLDAGVDEALRHLAATGRQKIGYVAPRASLSRQGEPRHQVYCEWMADLGQEPRVYAFEGPAFDVAAARDRTEAVFQSQDRPDALLCYNDIVALGVLAALRRCGVSCPEDAAVVGCDDLPLITQLDVPLTTIAYPLEAMCATAVCLLLERMGARGRPPEPRHVTYPAELKLRESSRATVSL